VQRSSADGASADSAATDAVAAVVGDDDEADSDAVALMPGCD